MLDRPKKQALGKQTRELLAMIHIWIVSSLMKKSRAGGGEVSYVIVCESQLLSNLFANTFVDIIHKITWSQGYCPGAYLRVQVKIGRVTINSDTLKVR